MPTAAIYTDAIYLSMIRDKNVNWCNALGRTKTRSMQNNGKRSCKNFHNICNRLFASSTFYECVERCEVPPDWGTCRYTVLRLTGQVCCTTLSHPAWERQNPGDNTPRSRCYHFTNQNFNYEMRASLLIVHIAKLTSHAILLNLIHCIVIIISVIKRN